MNVWAFGTFVLVTVICVAGWLANRLLEAWFVERWEARFYQPQLPVRRGRVIDVRSSSGPGHADVYGEVGGE